METDYKTLYEQTLKDYHDGAAMYDELLKKVEKYEAIIHTVEAFVGLKLIEEV